MRKKTILRYAFAIIPLLKKTCYCGNYYPKYTFLDKNPLLFAGMRYKIQKT